MQKLLIYNYKLFNLKLIYAYIIYKLLLEGYDVRMPLLGRFYLQTKPEQPAPGIDHVSGGGDACKSKIFDTS